MPCTTHSRRTRAAIPSMSETGGGKPTRPGGAGCCGSCADSIQASRRHFARVRSGNAVQLLAATTAAPCGRRWAGWQRGGRWRCSGLRRAPGYSATFAYSGRTRRPVSAAERPAWWATARQMEIMLRRQGCGASAFRTASRWWWQLGRSSAPSIPRAAELAAVWVAGVDAVGHGAASGPVGRAMPVGERAALTAHLTGRTSPAARAAAHGLSVA
jgi:hypothetical protein